MKLITNMRKLSTFKYKLSLFLACVSIFIGLSLLRNVDFAEPGTIVSQFIDFRTTQLPELPVLIPVYAQDQNLDTQAFQEPVITAQSAFVYDLSSGSILFEKNANTPMYPASATKLLTAIVAREVYFLDQIVSASLPQSSAGSVIDFLPTESQTVRSLLKASLIQSGNDAADLLAAHYPGGTEAFVSKMNMKAQELGMQQSFFENPSGLDSSLQRSSARDIAIVFKHALEDDFIRDTLQISQTNIIDASGQIARTLYTTNRLLWTDFVIAGKTGTTDQAGQVLVSLVSLDDTQIIIVVMKSMDRYADTISLYNWVERSFQWVDPAEYNLLH